MSGRSGLASTIDRRLWPFDHRLLKVPGPLPAVRGTADAAHPHAMVFVVPSWLARDDDVIAEFQRLAGDALAVQRRAGRPFDRIANFLPAGGGAFQMHERVGIAEDELNQIAFDGFCLLFV